MSEPVQKGEIDLTSLDQALNDGEAASKVPAETLQRNSDTLAQPPADAPSSSAGTATAAASGSENAHKASSPATLSPSSPRAMSPAPVAAQPASDVPPAVAELKVMFPDLDDETIAAVLSSRGGDQEAAVNALLQMSDPSFKPTTTESRTDADALLAQSIAAEEEQRHHQHLSRRQQQQHGSGRGGGGAGSFLSGLLNSDARESSAPSPPSYDPNALTYQPRVRRGAPANPVGSAASAAAAPGARTSYAPPNHPPGTSPSYESGDSLIPGMPGAREAKQWQDGINRMAETGLARAASTFSTFRQKASAAFNNPQDGTSQAGATGSSNSVSAGAGASAGSGFAQAFQNFRNSTGRGANTSGSQQSTSVAASLRQFTSPRSPHASEYDQDPSPVSENELANIITRGGAGGNASNPSAAGKSRALAERYGLGINNGNRVGSSQATGGSTGASDYASWEQAGRTPISITDNTTSKPSEANKTSKDTVALMDSASGRGITSPGLGRSPTRETPAAVGKTTATAVGAGAVGAGTAAVALDKHDDHDANDDSDDLEYVSNPFEDED